MNWGVMWGRHTFPKRISGHRMYIYYISCPFSLSLSVPANIPWNITWTKNSTKIDRNDGRVDVRKWAIFIEDLTEKDSGAYGCKVCNLHGCVNHTVQLQVQGKLMNINRCYNSIQCSISTQIFGLKWDRIDKTKSFTGNSLLLLN